MSAREAGRPFWVKAAAEPADSNGWRSASVEIFGNHGRVGGYIRNHAGWADTTFEPFEFDGVWYALYSSDYTATRVMRLPDCVDLGGEERSGAGFCPVEFYVPRYKVVTRTDQSTGEQVADEEWWFEHKAKDQPEKIKTIFGIDLNLGPWRSLSVGFVAGCHWGDDRSWKVEVIDLSHAAVGLISRSARFGYFEIPKNMSLREVIDLDTFTPE